MIGKRKEMLPIYLVLKDHFVYFAFRYACASTKAQVKSYYCYYYNYYYIMTDYRISERKNQTGNFQERNILVFQFKCNNVVILMFFMPQQEFPRTYNAYNVGLHNAKPTQCTFWKKSQ